MIKLRIALGLIAAAITAAAQTPEYGYQVIHAYPHDPNAFTQGLEFRAGYLYEGTGLKGRSSLRKVQLETGKVLQEIDLDSQYFGEGITVLNQQIIELTWQSETGFVYDESSFRRLRAFNYPGEGWGLTNDGQQIYMSDGTAQIRIWDPVTLLEKRRITVRDHGQPVMNLNELEMVRGQIYANIWQTDRIARISPTDGRVLGWIDLAGILRPADRTEQVDVLNGIAYDVLGNRLFVTGKLWPKLFEIKLIPKSQRTPTRRTQSQRKIR
jgi:glutaminyl-peptide cyclotransferase